MKFENATRYRQILSESVPFRGLDSAKLDKILETGMVLSAQKDELVFYEKMRGGLGLYVILEGEIEIFHSRTAEDGSEPEQIHLSTLVAGECLGEYSLIDGQQTSAAAKAQVDSKLFLLSRGSFEELVNNDPETGRRVYHNLLLFLVRRLRQYP